MYLKTKLPSPEYMKIHVSMIPQEYMKEYNVTKYLDEKVYAYVEIMGAIYVLIQSGYLANQDLIKILPHLNTTHPKENQAYGTKKQKIKFTLEVDEFRVKFLTK